MISILDWSKNHDTLNFYCWGIHIAMSHTHQLHNLKCRGINLCNAYISVVSACLASMISQKGNYTTIMLGELIANCMHTSYISITIGDIAIV